MTEFLPLETQFLCCPCFDWYLRCYSCFLYWKNGDILNIMTNCDISTVHLSEMDLATLLFLNIGVRCSPHFCYNEILRKVNSTKVNSLQSENLRNLKDKSLIQSIFCFITVYAGMHLPPLFTGFYYRFLYDKNTHMGWPCCSPHMNSCYVVISLVYSFDFTGK